MNRLNFVFIILLLAECFIGRAEPQKGESILIMRDTGGIAGPDLDFLVGRSFRGPARVKPCRRGGSAPEGEPGHRADAEADLERMLQDLFQHLGGTLNPDGTSWTRHGEVKLSLIGANRRKILMTPRLLMTPR